MIYPNRLTTAPGLRRAGRTTIDTDPQQPLPIFADHARDWQQNHYVYPVVSRRSGGLSIGINLNPDTACNFDCIYCQVDRSRSPRIRHVDPHRLEAELSAMIQQATDGSLFDHPRFADTPPELRRLNDIAFSGDGEPTTCPVFAECVERTARVRRSRRADDVRIVLITDACYLTRPAVRAGLDIMDESGGEIWAKLDAGTQEYYETVNRPNYPLTHVMDNIIAAATRYVVRIQSLFMNVRSQAPPDTEIDAYINRLREITASGGRIRQVQVYTVARKPAQSYVTALTDAQLDAITDRVHRETGLPAQAYYAAP